MKLNLEELKKLADAKPDNIIEALKVDGLTMIEAWKQLPLLISRIEELEKALRFYAKREITIHDEGTSVDMTNAFTWRALKALEGAKE